MKRIAKYCFIAGISLVMGSCGGAKREVEEVPEVPAAPAPPPPSEDFPEAPTAKSDESAANARAVRFTCPDGKFIKWMNYPQGYTVNVDGPEWMKRPDLQLTISLSSDMPSMLRMTLTGSGSSVLDGNYFVSGDERAGGGWSLMFRKVDNETIYELFITMAPLAWVEILRVVVWMNLSRQNRVVKQVSMSTELSSFPNDSDRRPALPCLPIESDALYAA